MDVRDIFVGVLWTVAIMLTCYGLFSFIKAKAEHEKYSNCYVTPIILGIALLMITMLMSMANQMRHSLEKEQAIGIQYEEEGRYDEAYEIYLTIWLKMGDWSDIEECMDRVRTPATYMNAGKLELEGKWFDAGMKYAGIMDYQDSTERFNLCMKNYLEGIK